MKFGFKANNNIKIKNRFKAMTLLIFGALLFAGTSILADDEFFFESELPELELPTMEMLEQMEMNFEISENKVLFPQDCNDYGIWDENISTCTLTQNLTESVKITEDNMTLDCNGHSITGNGSESWYGIYLNGKQYITIKNCEISNFSFGIYSFSSSNNTLSENIISDNNISGFWISGGENNNIIENTISDNECGFDVYGGTNNIIGNIIENNEAGLRIHQSNFLKIQDNNILNNPHGLDLYSSENIIIDDNYIETDGRGICFRGNKLVNSTSTNNIFNGGGFYFECSSENPVDISNNVFENNIINNKPLVYLESQSNQTINNAGQVIAINCNDITVQDLDLSNTYYGIQFIETNNSTIDSVNISDACTGIYLFNSSINTIFNSEFLDNRFDIQISNSFSNTIEGNAISAQYGIYTYHSSGNTLKHNTFFGCSGDAIWLYESNGNFIYHNNFIANNRDVKAFQPSLFNYFDNGYPNGGNYWYDYHGIDEMKGHNQDEPGSDGIGDTPHVLFTQPVIDHYPFMERDGWEAILGFCGNNVCDIEETFESCYQDCLDQGIEKYSPYYKYSLGEEYYLTSFYFDNDANVENNKENYIDRQGDWAKPYVYTHIVEDEDYLTIQYWKYEVYNEYPFWIDHDHDWDSTIFVVFDKPDLTQPIEVRFARHWYMGVYPWSEIEKIQNTHHPVVYVAKGSHGGYHSQAMKYLDEFDIGGLTFVSSAFNQYRVGNCIKETTKEINGEQKQFCLVKKELLRGDRQNEPANGYWANEFGDPVPCPWKPENAPGWSGPRWNQTRPIGLFSILEFGTACPVDLHIYDLQGRHIGINYETNEPEIEIPGAIFKQEGDKQYIMIPNPLKQDYQVEIVGTDDGEYDFTMIASENTGLIEIQEKTAVPIAKDEVQIFVIVDPWKSPKEIKQKAIIDLESIENDNEIIQQHVQKVINLINKSLNEKYWIDDSHLTKKGIKVFSYGLKAVKRLKLIKELNQELNLNDPQLSDIVEETIKGLTKADYLLAKTSINQAKDIDIENSYFKKLIERLIIKAEIKLFKAKENLENDESVKSIIYSRKSWVFSQLAIKIGGYFDN